MGALVVDAQSGSMIYERNAGDAFVPASTIKLIVGSAALDRLGTAFTFTTILATDGTTFYLKGSGDPLLDALDAQDAARTVRELDAPPSSTVVGDVSRYTSSRYPDGWQVDDLPFDYAAPVSPLSFEENALHLTLTPGAAAGQPVAITVQPVTHAYGIENRTTTGGPHSSDTSTLEFNWTGTPSLIVTGSVPAGAQPVTLDAAIPDPAHLTLERFAAALAPDGAAPLATTTGIMPPSARVLWQHRSPALPQLLRDMWQPSDNLLAETLLDELGVAAPGAGDTRARGLAVEGQWLHSIGVHPSTVFLADGSGMSSYDRVTPRALVAVLAHDWNSPQRGVVLAALPVAGKSGTLDHLFTGEPLAGNVIAKTGTATHTRTLAGYLQTPHGTLIFALLVNDWMDGQPDAAARLHRFQEQFLRRIRAGSAGV